MAIRNAIVRRLHKMSQRLLSFLYHLWGPIKRKGGWHWAQIAILIVLGAYLGHQLGERQRGLQWRYRIYRFQQALSGKTWVKRTRLVLVEDDDYWQGELARRAPIKRDYLARLLRAIARADPVVIALDFDLRSPTPDGSIPDHSDYASETDEFIRAVREIAETTKVVLPTNVNFNPHGSGYITESTIYDRYPLPPGKVLKGYIELPYDLRQVPLPLPLPSGHPVDSLASAVARAAGETEALRRALAGHGALPYGRFLEAESFKHFPASQVLRSDQAALRDMLGHRVVVVGANWSRLAYGRGGRVDETSSPIGRVGAVFIHANYIEALINSDASILRPLGEKTAIALEIVISFGIAYIFALSVGRSRKVVLALLACGGVIAFSYFFWQNLGLFFDFFIPLILLLLHACYEQIAGWREAAVECRRRHGDLAPVQE
jgi:CHASE2 domain-containing sensor protein